MYSQQNNVAPSIGSYYYCAPIGEVLAGAVALPMGVAMKGLEHMLGVNGPGSSIFIGVGLAYITVGASWLVARRLGLKI